MKNLNYDDCRCCELKTVVKDVIEEKGLYWHRFEQTIFFIDEKNHIADQGYVNGLEVLKLKHINGSVYHLLPERLEGSVFLVLNRHLRYRNAQNQTAIQLIGSLMQAIYHAHILGYGMEEYDCWVDLDIEPLTEAQRRELQVSLNGLIREDAPVKVIYEKQKRYISIGNFGMYENNNVHVPSLKFIQMIKIMHIEKTEKGMRLHFLCGDQLLSTMEKYTSVLKESCAILQTTPLYLTTAIYDLLNYLKK